MTNEERKAAEHLAYLHTIGEPSSFQAPFIAGYAAACEAKQAEIDRLIDAYNDQAKCRAEAFQFIEAERARSAKLIEAIKILRDGNHENTGEYMDKLFQELAEYEACRD